MDDNKTRLDRLLVERGLAKTRTRAQNLVLSGHVMIGERQVCKPGQQVPHGAQINVTGQDHPWVSRGGIKLAHALNEFDIDVTGAVAIDVGSSTGGFTDVLISKGAARVYAVDSGTEQLAQKLRNDDRVIIHEQTSARILTDVHIPQHADIIVCDASFISLAKVLERPITFARYGAQMIALIKPQFEAGRSVVGKSGVVRDPAIHARICYDVRAWMQDSGWRVKGLINSPITGPKGNTEFLIWSKKETISPID